MDNAIFRTNSRPRWRRIRCRLAAGALWLRISTEVLGLAGFDWLVLDAEHARNDVTTRSFRS